MAAPEHLLSQWSVGKTLYGEEVKLEELSGQAVIISYWSAGTKEDEKSLAILSAAHRKFQSKGLVVIAAEMRQLEKKDVDAALGGKDPGFAITRGARGPVALEEMPHSFVFGPMGSLIYSGLPSDPEFSTALNKALLNSKPRSGPVKRAPLVKVDLIPERKWLNSSGKDVIAAVIAIEDDQVMFRMEDGRKLPYPIKQLSAADQRLIRETAKK